MNSFDFSLYDYEDDSPAIKVSKPEKSTKQFDFSLYDQEEEEQEQVDEESLISSLFRTGAQYPIGIAEATTPGLIAGGLQFLGMGEVYDPEEIEHIRAISEREGIPFDEEAYLESAQNALQYFPTVSNVARIIEEQTGIPLEAKEWYQKALRLGSMGGKLQPGNIVQKGTAGAVGAGTSEVLQRLGVPAPFADLLGLSVGAGAGAATKGAEVSLTKTKPSGLTERGFESLKKPREVTEGKFEQINTKLKDDFQKVTDEIVKGTPVEETIEQLKNDPTYKQQSRELFREAEDMALDLAGKHSTDKIKESLIKRAVETKGQGYKLGEYRQNYAKFLKDEVNNIRKGEFDAFDLVRQYRENNQDLGEYFKPGESKAFNRAKRDALLDHNRAIVDVMEELYPETEFVKTFKEGNERWAKIMDAEAIGEFVDELFQGKVNYKKAHDFFDKEGLTRPFKRALGEEGFKDFEQLMKDLTESESAYKMLKVAKSKGWDDLYKTAIGYILHPNLGLGKAGFDLAKGTYKRMMNFMLDKPKISLMLKKGVDNLKKGKFPESEQAFKDVEAELYPVNEKPKAKLEREHEVLEAKIEPINEKEKPQEKVKETKLLEGKNKEPLKEKLNIKTEKERYRSRYSYIKNLENEKGEWKGEFSYDVEPNGEVHISHMIIDEKLRRQGLAKKILKEIIEENPNSKLVFSALQPDGAKFLSSLLEKEIKPIFDENMKFINPKHKYGEDYTRILTNKEQETLKKNLGIKSKTKK